MPTVCGLRRLGYTPSSIRALAERVGVAKRNSTVDLDLLKWCIREELNQTAPRVMAVLRPLKIVITNYPEDQVEQITCVNNPEDDSAGTRTVPFCRELWIERDDFREEAPRKFFRLKPGQEVRLKHAYYITCDEVIKDPDTGEVVELRCSYDPESQGGSTPDGRKVRGTLHWVSARHAFTAEVRLYDNLFKDPFPEAGGNFLDNLNPDSLEVVTEAKAGARPGRSRGGLSLPVHAPGVFLCGFGGLEAGQAGLQPHHHVAGFMGEAGGEGQDRELTSHIGRQRPSEPSTPPTETRPTGRVSLSEFTICLSNPAQLTTTTRPAAVCPPSVQRRKYTPEATSWPWPLRPSQVIRA